MDYSELKKRVGDDPYDLAAAIQSECVSAAERIPALFEAFEDLPSYGMVMYLKWEFDEAPEGLRTEILTRFLRYLEGEDEALVEPVLYTLWCDYFEDPRTVEETWQHLVGPTTPPLVLQRILPRCGPVPWRLKRSLLESLVEDPRWHRHVFECLLYSFLDVYGDIDIKEAKRMFNRLDLPPDTQHLDKLAASLGNL